MPRICPKCGHFTLHRSRSRNAIERWLKALTFLRPYRCGNCDWRGYLKKEKFVNKRELAKNLLMYLITIIIAFLFAFLLRGVF